MVGSVSIPQTSSLATAQAQSVTRIENQANANLVAQASTQRDVATFARNGDIAGARQYMEKHPESIDAMLQAFAAVKPGLVPQLVEVSGAVVTKHIEAQ
jgi:hypothetical protein